MLMIALFGILSAFAVLVVMARMNLKRFMGYPVACDIVVTLLLTLILMGSFSGMVAAIIGGLAFSGLVTLYRRLFGYERLVRTGFKLQWVRYDGLWSINTIRRKAAAYVAGK